MGKERRRVLIEIESTQDELAEAVHSAFESFSHGHEGKKEFGDSSYCITVSEAKTPTIFVVTIQEGGSISTELFTKKPDAMQFAKDQAEDHGAKKVPCSSCLGYWVAASSAGTPVQIVVEEKTVDYCVD